MLQVGALQLDEVRHWVLDCVKKDVIVDFDHLQTLMTMVKPPVDTSQRTPPLIRQFEMVPDQRPSTQRQTALPPDSPKFRQLLRDKEAKIAQLGNQIHEVGRLYGLYASGIYANGHERLAAVEAFVESHLHEETAGCERHPRVE
jgi:hypothetical protein